MPRIRSVKPEFFTSETILALSHAARLTFIGLWTAADDTGRARDDARLIKGAVWALEDQMPHTQVADHLDELAAADLICRYEADGKRYLHVTNWDEHQAIARPSKPKHPECPRTTHGGPPEPSLHPSASQGDRSESGSRPDTLTSVSVSHGDDTASQCNRSAPHVPEVEVEVEVEQGSGVPPSAGREPAPATDPPTLTLINGEYESDLPALDLDEVVVTPTTPVTAQTLLGEHLHALTRRPPKRVIGHLSGEIKKLLDEGIDPTAIRGGLEILRDRGLDPSKLPSTTNQALNPPRPWPRGRPGKAEQQLTETLNTAALMQRTGPPQGGELDDLGGLDADRGQAQRALAGPADQRGDRSRVVDGAASLQRR